MDSNDLDNYLDEFASGVTEEQREKILGISGIVDAVFSGEDHQDERMEMFSTAVQVILGDESVSGVIGEWKKSVQAMQVATARMRGAVAVAVGESNESAVSEKYNLNRGTIRKAVGK